LFNALAMASALADASCTAIVITCDLRNCASTPIVDNTATAIIAKNNLGYVNEKSGTKTDSGTGAKTTFTIAHGLSGYVSANYINVLPATIDAKNNLSSISVDNTNIVLTYSVAPPSGTNNLVWYWEAKYNK
jgi:ABC-type Mn2+/Zn2+ transport system permease subunit